MPTCLGALHRDALPAELTWNVLELHSIEDEEGEDECKPDSSPRIQVNLLRHLMHPLNPIRVCILLCLAPFPPGLVGINHPLTSKACGSLPGAAICLPFYSSEGITCYVESIGWR